MAENDFQANEEIFSKALRAGRRTYFFDVRATKAGDYYLTITESKKFSQETGESEYKKHKIYLYKEDFDPFRALLDEATDFILAEKGEEVISERHVKDFKKPDYDQHQPEDLPVGADRPKTGDSLGSRFTDIEFEDI